MQLFYLHELMSLQHSQSPELQALVPPVGAALCAICSASCSGWSVIGSTVAILAI